MKQERIDWVIKTLKEKYPDSNIKYNGCGCHECGAETNTLSFTVDNISDKQYEAFEDYIWELTQQSEKESGYELMIHCTFEKRGKAE